MPTFILALTQAPRVAFADPVLLRGGVHTAQ
jgi:hypothetical protein